MTTQEAYKAALAMANEGTPYKKIALELARAGYVSRKTGRKLCNGAISVMVNAAKKGYTPKNYKRRARSFAHLYQPKSKTNGEVGVEAMNGGNTTGMTMEETVATAKELAKRHEDTARAIYALVDFCVNN